MKPLLFIVFIFFSLNAFAQGDPGDNPDVDVPLDGGVSALVIAGAAYGAKKLKDMKKK